MISVMGVSGFLFEVTCKPNWIPCGFFSTSSFTSDTVIKLQLRGILGPHCDTKPMLNHMPPVSATIILLSGVAESAS